MLHMNIMEFYYKSFDNNFIKYLHKFCQLNVITEFMVRQYYFILKIKKQNS